MIKLNQKGQGLIEYIILVALIAVASIGIVRVLSQVVSNKFTNITHGLQGGAYTKASKVKIDTNFSKRKDLSDFLNGATHKSQK